jgi:hypothetical protein
LLETLKLFDNNEKQEIIVVFTRISNFKKDIMNAMSANYPNFDELEFDEQDRMFSNELVRMINL